MSGLLRALGVLSYTSLILLVGAPVVAQEQWQDVAPAKALFEFTDAKRILLKQKETNQATLERSSWELEDGSVVHFNVTWADAMWVYTDQGESLEAFFSRAFPQGELVKLGEPFVSREFGTQGDAQWLRFRLRGEECVLLQQYGWCDCDIDGGTAEIRGNRLAYGTYCGATALGEPEIRRLFGRIDF